jgi:hypothetical protein
MPILSFFELTQGSIQPDSIEGFLSESRTLIKEIQDIARADRITGPALLHRVLTEGPCPGPWRVFHGATNPAIVTDPPPLPFDGEWFLGVRVGRSNSVRLGQQFDGWVVEANREANARHSIGPAGDTPFANTSPELGNFYSARVATIRAPSGGPPSDPATLIVGIKPQLNPFPGVLTRAEPDGLFASSPAGAAAAVFEAKVSHPDTDKLDLDMGVYSLYAGLAHDRPFTHKIVLTANFPAGNLEVKSEQISLSALGLIRINLQRLNQIVNASHLRFRSNSKPSSKRTSWRQFLVPPRPPRPQDHSEACPSCPYNVRCWETADTGRGQ